MSEPLNPLLYRMLERCFGEVRIENVGDPGNGHYGIDAVTLRVRRRGGGGEQYVVRCPFCNDGSGHLYLSYPYGERDPDTDCDNRHLAHCFRERCLADGDNRRALYDMNFSIRPAAGERRTRRTAGPPAGGGEGRVRRVTPPCALLPLTGLYKDSSPVGYLQSRGFDIKELADVWRVAYAAEPSRVTQLTGRLYIPIYLDGILVGWQGRWLGELDWKVVGLPKYYNMAGLPKGRLLYNIDLARRQPLVVVVEGVTDAWRVGPAAVATFGKDVSGAQAQLLAACWHEKPIVILLDADAAQEAEALRRRIEALRPGRVVVVQLPDGLDPGSSPSKRVTTPGEPAQAGVASPASLAAAVRVTLAAVAIPSPAGSLGPVATIPTTAGVVTLAANAPPGVLPASPVAATAAAVVRGATMSRLRIAAQPTRSAILGPAQTASVALAPVALVD